MVYIISAISWGMVMWQLGQTIYHNKDNRPPLLVPLAIASLALFLESLYFGIFAIFHYMGLERFEDFMLHESNWFLIKVLIAVSGVLLLFNLKIEKRQ
jgi:hypothetical protein